jgi:hypothetical protein
MTANLDIASVTNEAITQNRVLKFKLKSSQGWSSVDGTSDLVEPLQFPLFFPYGEKGWSVGSNKKLPYTTYLASRLLMPEKWLRTPSLDRERIWNCNRFTLLDRLGQYYIVDAVSRMIGIFLICNL